MQSLFIVLLLGAGLLLWNWYKQAPPSQRKKIRNHALLIALGLVLLVGLISGRLNPAIAGVVALIAGAMNVMGMLQRLQSVQRLFGGGSSQPSGGQSSQVETPMMRVTLDHDSGAMDGEVTRGQFAGRRLSELTQLELEQLYRECAASDGQSRSVLEAYLDRDHVGWRDRFNGADATGRSSGGTAPARTRMDRGEAAEVLGVEPDAGREEVVAAHRRLMQRLHPDRGGSDFLAAKINEAKDVMLRG